MSREKSGSVRRQFWVVGGGKLLVISTLAKFRLRGEGEVPTLWGRKFSEIFARVIALIIRFNKINCAKIHQT